MGRLVPDSAISPSKKMCTYEYLHEVWNLKSKWQFNEEAFLFELRAGHPDHHLRCPVEQVKVYQYLTVNWKISDTEIWRDKRLLVLFRISSYPTIILLIPCLIVANFKTVVVLSLRLRLSFLSFFNDALLPNFDKIVDHEILIFGAQQLEDIFSIVCTNRRACL
jgi:hypothetical protein